MGIRMEVKLTDGYQQRFTSACLAQIGSRKEVTKIEDGNEGYFGEKAIGTCLGTMSESGNVAYIFPSTLNQALTKAGYSPRKTLKYMADNGLIATASEGSDSKQRYSVKRRFDGRSCRFVEFKIGQFSEKDDDIESEADKYEQESFTDSDGFMSPEGMEEELPFK